MEELEKLETELKEGKNIDEIDYNELMGDLKEELSGATVAFLQENVSEENYEIWKMRFMLAAAIASMMSICSCVLLWKMQTIEKEKDHVSH